MDGRAPRAPTNHPRSAAPFLSVFVVLVWWRDRRTSIREHGGMSEYKAVERRLADKDVVILDGALGTQLQKMACP
jgi:hypothetical protein